MRRTVRLVGVGVALVVAAHGLGCGDDATPAVDASSGVDAGVGGDGAPPGDSGGVDSGGERDGGGVVPVDDTHGCLESYAGPIVVVSGTITTETTRDSGYDPDSSELADETRYDARGAVFRLGPSGDSQAEGVAFNFTDAIGDDDSACVAGGVYRGIYSRGISWEQGHHGDGQLAYVTAPDTIFDGLRVDNVAQDAPTIGDNAQGFAVTNSWFSYVRDDCLENDDRFSARIVDNLYDGCYTFLSHQAESTRDGSAERVVVEGNLIRMQNMPMPYDYQNYGNDPTSMGHGQVFKQATGPDKPTVDVVGNVFWIEPNLTPRPSLRDAVFEVELGECRDNLLIWTGSDPWPDPSWEALPPGCITRVLRGSEGLSAWDAIRRNWIDCHPRVGRVDGDPASDVSRCDPAVYGGGGTALP
jgi:hypothetical protein